LLALVAAAACSSSHQSSGDDAAAASAAPGAAGQYPSWAAAVVAEYPNRVDAGSVTDKLFQIDTADDPKTVVAWFKAHAPTPVTASDPDSAPRWFVNTSGVAIDIDPNNYAGTTGIKTMIAFSRK
jgi:cytochrome c553